MTSLSHGAAAERMAVYGAAATIVGLLLSGPLGLALVTLVAPQPPWKGPMVFVEHFQRVQTLPFLASFIHAVGYVFLMSAFYQVADVRMKTRGMAAFGFTLVFVTLVSFSYISQTTFLPALTGGYHPDNDFAISMLSMANPRSLSWVSSVGLWISRPRHLARRADFHRTPLERLTAKLLVVQWPRQISPARFWTAVDLTLGPRPLRAWSATSYGMY